MNYKERAKIIVGLAKRGSSYRIIAQWVRRPNENPVSRERIRQILVAELGWEEVRRMIKAKKGSGNSYAYNSWEIAICQRCSKKFLSIINLEAKFCSKRCFKEYRDDRVDKRSLRVYKEVVSGKSLLSISNETDIRYATLHKDYCYAVKELGMPDLNIQKRYHTKRALAFQAANN